MTALEDELLVIDQTILELSERREEIVHQLHHPAAHAISNVIAFPKRPMVQVETYSRKRPKAASAIWG